MPQHSHTSCSPHVSQDSSVCTSNSAPSCHRVDFKYMASICCARRKTESIDLSLQQRAADSGYPIDSQMIESFHSALTDKHNTLSLKTVNLTEPTPTPLDKPLIKPGSLMSQSAHQDYAITGDLDLICSIAGTYNLPSDSDTYSYISNCLRKSNSSTTLDRPRRRRRRSKHAARSQCSTLASDQMYPERVMSTTSLSNQRGSNYIRQHTHCRHKQRKSRSLRSQRALRERVSKQSLSPTVAII